MTEKEIAIVVLEVFASFVIIQLMLNLRFASPIKHL